MRLGLALAIVLCGPNVARAGDAEDKIRVLTEELAKLRAELEKRKSPTRSVLCSRADLQRSRPAYDGPTRDTEMVLRALTGLGVSPVYERRDFGKSGQGPAYYQVQDGCAFLPGERITAVNSAPMGDRARVEQELSYATEWRFTVEPPSATGTTVTIEASRSSGFDLAPWLGLSRRQAIVAPAFTEGRENGFLVFEVAPDGDLSRAGLRDGDLLIAVNDTILTHRDAERTIKGFWLALGKLAFKVERGGKPFYLTPIADAARTPPSK